MDMRHPFRHPSRFGSVTLLCPALGAAFGAAGMPMLFSSEGHIVAYDMPMIDPQEGTATRCAQSDDHRSRVGRLRSTMSGLIPCCRGVSGGDRLSHHGDRRCAISTPSTPCLTTALPEPPSRTVRTPGARSEMAPSRYCVAQEIGRISRRLVRHSLELLDQRQRISGAYRSPGSIEPSPADQNSSTG